MNRELGMTKTKRVVWGLCSYALAATVFGAGLYSALVATRREEARQRAAYVAMSERQEALYALINSDNHGLAILDEDGLIVEWNEALEKWSGYKQAELLGTPIVRLMDRESAARHTPAFRERMDGDGVDRTRVTPIKCKLYPKASQVPVWLQANVRAVYPEHRPDHPYAIALINPVAAVEGQQGP
jgi:PAS domain S-box-containing protein